MLYTSVYDHLTLLRNNGEIAHKFVNGELIVGTPTGTGAGNEIDFTTQTPAERTIQRPFQFNFSGTLLTTDAGKAGLGTTFFATPPIASGTAVTAGTRYTVLTGTVENNNTTYYAGETFKAVGTTTAGAGTFKLAIPSAADFQEGNEFLKEHYKIKALLTGDEAEYIPQAPGGTSAPNFNRISS